MTKYWILGLLLHQEGKNIMAKKEMIKDDSAEEKIKQAAKKLFTQKGYAAVKTRDIATEAGINIALLHYYYRSKEKLFELIMVEALQHFILGIKDMMNDKTTSLEKKIEQFVDRYIDMLIASPNLPLFILSEIRANPLKFASKMKMKDFLPNSYIMEQFMAKQRTLKNPLHPMHFLMNLIGLTVFPFVGAPLLQQVGNVNQTNFTAMMLERKKLIPAWIATMMKQ